MRIIAPPIFRPLTKPARYKGAYGGRGSGKSHFFAESLVEQCLMRPTRAVCVREVQKSLEQSVKLLVEDKIHGMGVDSHFQILQSHINAPQGGIISFQGMQNYNADNIKSLEGYDISWVEEAQSLSQRSLDLLRPTIRKENPGDDFRPQSELWFSWNPNLPTDPVDVLLRSESTPPGSVVVEANFNNNPWFPEVLRKEMEWDRSRDIDKYNHIWRGQYEQISAARVFKNWRVEEFNTPGDAQFYFGADWGFSVDPSVLIRCYIQGRRLYFDHEAYMVGCEIDDLPKLFAGKDGATKVEELQWATIGHKWPGIPGAKRWKIVADSARPETISYMRRKSFDVEPAIKGKDSVKEGIEFLQNYDIIIHPRCKHTIDEFSFYSWKTDKLTGEIIPVLEDDNNHVIDAARYAVENVRNHTPLNIPPSVLQRSRMGGGR